MSITKNIKCIDENTSKSIKQILNIKNSHITFSKDAISQETLHGQMANVFNGLLTGEANRCEYCGVDSVIRHAYQDNWIQLLPYQEVPTYLHLYKQRFRCTQCHHTFSAKTYYVAENCYISNESAKEKRSTSAKRLPKAEKILANNFEEKHEAKLHLLQAIPPLLKEILNRN